MRAPTGVNLVTEVPCHGNLRLEVDVDRFLTFGRTRGPPFQNSHIAIEQAMAKVSNL